MPTIELEEIEVGQISLDLENPRHEKYDTQEDVIAFLVKNESIKRLTRDIVENGLNPLDPFGLIKVKSKKGSKRPRYTVEEGNRRICSLKLLHDPDLAPPKDRAYFQQLSDDWSPINSILAVVFNSSQEFNLWKMRIHAGVQDGMGRKPWSPEQKTRHTGNPKNLEALHLLDYAQSKGFINEAERKNTLTTVQRYVGNKMFKEAMGIDSVTEDGMNISRPQAEFDIIVDKFIGDLKTGTVNSRTHAPERKEYAREFSVLPGVTNARTEPMRPGQPAKKHRKKLKPKKSAAPRFLEYDEPIFKAVKKLKNKKLEEVYYSLCKIDLAQHTIIVGIGVWAFLETLTAVHGRDGSNFESYLNPQRLEGLGLGNKTKTKTLRAVISRVAEYGNTNKHHKQAANFNSKQIHNDMIVMTDLVLALCAPPKK
tara:strand:- start:1016 stop:2287 length:1272 start_codon:yes stop_codon:yes gene_type:complete